jgi:hypothetical protein
MFRNNNFVNKDGQKISFGFIYFAYIPFVPGNICEEKKSYYVVFISLTRPTIREEKIKMY